MAETDNCPEFHCPKVRSLCMALLGAVLSAGCSAVYEPDLIVGHQPTPNSLAGKLAECVTHLASGIGERNCYYPEQLEAAGAWIEQQFRLAGYGPRRLPVRVPAGPPFDCGERVVWNIEAQKRGTTRPEEVIIVGAHYDSKAAAPGWHARGPVLPERPGTPGANDNASGVAAVLALARIFADRTTQRTLRFVTFVNEEPPFFQTEAMGSRSYAHSCAGDGSVRVVGMIALDEMGCFSAKSGRKRPWAASLIGLPDSPDYVAFVSNLHSRPFARQCASVFREHSPVVLRTTAVPPVSDGVAWSDDWSFWQQGIPAFTVTDTSYLRNEDHHELTDTPDKLDYAPMADVVWGMTYVVDALANPAMK